MYKTYNAILIRTLQAVAITNWSTLLRVLSIYYNIINYNVHVILAFKKYTKLTNQFEFFRLNENCNQYVKRFGYAICICLILFF